MMWGAKVKTPVDMRDDILKDAIEVTTKELLNADETLDQIGMYCIICCILHIHCILYYAIFMNDKTKTWNSIYYVRGVDRWNILSLSVCCCKYFLY